MCPYFETSDLSFSVFHGDTMELLDRIDNKVDVIYADPPYFLSRGY